MISEQRWGTRRHLLPKGLAYLRFQVEVLPNLRAEECIPLMKTLVSKGKNISEKAQAAHSKCLSGILNHA